VFPWEHQSIYALLHRHRFTRPHNTRPHHTATRRNTTERRGEDWEEEEESVRDADGGVGSEAEAEAEAEQEPCALTGRRWTRCYAHAHTCYRGGDKDEHVDKTGAGIPGGAGRGGGGEEEEDTNTDSDTDRVCLWHLVRSPHLSHEYSYHPLHKNQYTHAHQYTNGG
jgi:hypothetical protein